MQHYTT